MTSTDRRARIELLRARAQYERILLRRAACDALEGLRPDALASGASAGLRAAGMGWLAATVRTLRRYPMLLSLASSVVSGARVGHPYARLGVAALLVWRMLRAGRRG
ncbi:hypothetical protein [Castellaniella sp. GW247-6E4]|uniref:hypothetical protein n=1 Tax=Castellaniella sp. GW247-6E4 TaxID=3140380 RepID=UPI0033145742